MNIAVFADLHGRVLLAFLLCARWQRETGEQLSAILQAGDLGAYPDERRLDRATMRHALHDPQELGYLRDFAEARSEVASRLAETSCSMIFVRGNHEDHAWLDRLEQQTTAATFPIDPYGRIQCLRTGMAYTLSDAGEALTVLGIGRIGSPPGSAKAHRPKFAQPRELERLYALGPLRPDILLTHDVPPDFARPRGPGLAEIRLILDEYQPLYHFYGHTEEPYRYERDRNQVTTSIRMADLTWDRTLPGAPLVAGSMGILRWRNRADHAFEVVDAGWLNEYSARGWRRR